MIAFLFLAALLILSNFFAYEAGRRQGRYQILIKWKKANSSIIYNFLNTLTELKHPDDNPDYSNPDWWKK